MSNSRKSNIFAAPVIHHQQPAPHSSQAPPAVYVSGWWAVLCTLTDHLRLIFFCNLQIAIGFIRFFSEIYVHCKFQSDALGFSRSVAADSLRARCLPCLFQAPIRRSSRSSRSSCTASTSGRRSLHSWTVSVAVLSFFLDLSFMFGD